MTTMTPALALASLAAFAAAVFLTARLRTLARTFGTLDVPNERSSHTVPTPRGGGASFVMVTVVAAGWIAVEQSSQPFAVYVITALVIAGISLVDDLRSLPALVRLMVHIACAGATVLAAQRMEDLPVASAILFAAATLWIVSLTNIFNFMDGIDGIAASQAAVTFAALGLYSARSGDPHLTSVAFVAAAGTAGFLVLNWQPARIFMGDVGSAFLGFSIGALSVLNGDPLAVMVAFAAAWPFIFDASLTIARRLLRGENILQSHRSHLYQRLVIAGYSHSRVAVLYTVLAVATSATGLFAAADRLPAWVAGFVLCAAAAALVFLVRAVEIGKRERTSN